MDGCNLICNLITFGVIGYVIWNIWSSKENARKAANNRNVNALNGVKSNFHKLENDVANDLNEFFKKTVGSYEEVYGKICHVTKELDAGIAQMKNYNRELQSKRHDEDYSSTIYALESRNLPKMQGLSVELFSFGQRVRSLPESVMMVDGTYGNINKTYWNEVTTMSRREAESYVNQCDNLLNNAKTDINGVFTIDAAKLLKCVWFFATEKTFSASDFQKATSVFQRTYKAPHVDVMIADLYAKKKMGGEDVLRDTVNGFMKVIVDSMTLTRIASSLMWMNAYQTENAVLQHMLTSGKEMTAKTQERLHSLTNGGGKAPSGFEVKSKADELYFDVSALAWRDDEYIGLFENLAFQDKVLTYSLALREENKDLFIPQGIQVPDAALMLKKLQAVFAEEYGPSVTARSVHCVALSGNGEERIDGILAVSGECSQMGVLIHVARIGKKLIIKFYTLFTPTGSDLAAQKQQALSMYKKLSPTVTMWEGSLKDTMLMAVEQLLNTSAQSGVENSSAFNGEPGETVF